MAVLLINVEADEFVRDSAGTNVGVVFMANGRG